MRSVPIKYIYDLPDICYVRLIPNFLSFLFETFSGEDIYL